MAAPAQAPLRSRAELVQRLLDGELLDLSELAYDFSANHLGVVADGSGAEEALREAVGARDCRLLLVRREGDAVWAWLGSRFDLGSVARELRESRWPAGVALAFGEPADGLAGWRLTHRQAAAALPAARRGPDPIVRYADVALLSSASRDELLAESLRRIYLEPLESARDSGRVARQTLRAYIAAGRSTSSAAAALGVKRHTVTNRLREVEATLGRPLEASMLEIEVALRLEGIATGGR